MDLRQWLLGLRTSDGDKGANTLLRRWLLTIFFIVILGIPAFGWVQYRQAQNLERLTDQSFSNFEWDAFKLELRVIALHRALHEAVTQPELSQLLAQASIEYNLFAAQVALIEKGRSQESMADQPIFQTVLAQALSFLKLADPVLEDVQPKPDYQLMRTLCDQLHNLQASIHRLVIESHDLRSSRANKLIKEVQGIDYYFALLSAVTVMLGAGWGLSAMHNLALLSKREKDLRELYLKSSFSASHDFLTGLANRRLLADQLKHAIASNKRNGLYGVFILIDLDHFKPVNDTYGHDAGDKLLVEAASRMKRCVRDVDTVARVGGDEFAVLLGQVDGQMDQASDTASVIARKLLDTLSVPYQLSVPVKNAPDRDIEFVCTASMGVVMFFRDTLTADQIFQAADAAMYHAKQSGGNWIELATQYG